MVIRIWRQSVNLTASAFKQKQLIPYVTFGLPSVQATRTVIEALFQSGIDIIELGIPFSDPIADGPVIQKSHQAALSSGEDVSILAALDMVSELKEAYPKACIYLMCSVHLVMHVGHRSFFEQASQVGLDGVIMPDLSINHADAYLDLGLAHGIHVVLLLSVFSDLERRQRILSRSQGFCYLISSAGTTGTRSTFHPDLYDQLHELKREASVPLVVGFGIQSADHVRSITSIANGVVVGSFFESILQQDKPLSVVIDMLIESVNDLKSGLVI